MGIWYQFLTYLFRLKFFNNLNILERERQRPTRIPTPHVRPRGAPGLVMGPCIVEIDRIVIRDVQYQFKINGCRNEEVNFQGSRANSVGGDSGQDGRTDGRRR
ncbi:hypothetical protein DPMN_129323 [Dreissena polymorpha]|uniref:Uncharacterized protein n=1 Tax=Dreissena polymorpha TaxID=45954 RepID=A0A9D4H100_DREPO|nr:hypothetical protein DPMN_129323 [Dreissena polymorpha]